MAVSNLLRLLMHGAPLPGNRNVPASKPNAWYKRGDGDPMNKWLARVAR